MTMNFIKKIPTPDEIISETPLPEDIRLLKESRDAELRRVFDGTSDKFLLIIGPCSADNEESVCEYIGRLARINEQVKDKLILIPRIYTNKPRTTGEGYKGMMHQPDPGKKSDMFEGIKAIRRLHIRALCDYGLPAADEMLYPGNYAYLADVLGYHTIGARSVEDQLHRFTVSGVDAPVGMKNPTSGDLTVMLNSIRAAQTPQRFVYNEWEVETSGNPYAHAVLRGAVDSYGRNFPNYHYEDLISVGKAYVAQGLSKPAIIVDTNHSNSMKHYDEQPRIAHEVMMSRKYDSFLTGLVKGLMIESYLVSGRQEIGDNCFGQSITDPCLGWSETEELILHVADKV